MNPESLIASAAINFGLAFIVLSLFSILKTQPSNEPIYYQRHLSKLHRIPFHHSLTPSRFLPSISWILCAFRGTEDEFLDVNGLDALFFIRIFKFGIRGFGVCSFVGLVILLPVNFSGEDEASRIYHSMESFKYF